MGSFGERMRREREMRGISLDEIAAATKIGTRSLRALEDEEFGKLPGGIFNKGFVRSYSRFLGINEEQAVSDYLAAVGEPEDKAPEISIEKLVAQHDLEKNPPRPRSKELESINAESSGFPWLALIAIILIVVTASGGWKLYLRHKEQMETKRAELQAAQAAQLAAVPMIPQQTAPALSPDTSIQQQTPVETSQTSPAASGRTLTGTQPSAPATTVSPETATPDGGFTVSVRAKGKAWVSITADGKKIMSGTLEPPNEQSVRAHDRVIFRTGNAGGVEIAFNGKVLEPIGQPSEVRTVVITSNGAVQ